MTHRFASLLALALAASLPGQVLFSRRIYQQSGPTFQQIWTWNPATGVLQPLTHSARNHYNPACSANLITFSSGESWDTGAKLWTFNPDTQEERILGAVPALSGHPPPPPSRCDASAKAGDWQACAKKEDLSLSRAGKPVHKFHIQTDHYDTPIQSLKWSSDRKWLLIEENGLDNNSTARQSDYYVVDLASMKLSKAASALQALWLPASDELLYVTPRKLAPLPGARKDRDVWVQHLMRFNPVTGKTTAITSGLSNNFGASVCSR